MSANREGADLWFFLFGRWSYNGKWRAWDLFGRKVWTSPYFWHDSFGKYWQRLIGCNHTPKQLEEGRWHCFKCEREAPPETKEGRLRTIHTPSCKCQDCNPPETPSDGE